MISDPPHLDLTTCRSSGDSYSKAARVLVEALASPVSNADPSVDGFVTFIFLA